ncbi:class I SAM-dependent methyltransferase [Bradyrhizobium brasilense]|uniref:class I SAM-dependent methyltransferase n=1 Tax=Bradyrhizobium brasilense TaxID=1419277 RepID=UPI001E2DE033|nr:class I SAM-dependent methyltransferase [Bradyrhizobium brasilense]MCC8973310.1 class I SAM-dependent methyltransferase [Bradyrhizobium brasilense]
MNKQVTWRLYDGSAVGYDEYRPHYPEGVFDILSRYHAAPAPLRSAADIGAGTGIFSRQLMESVPSIETLTCVEANSDMVAVAKERSSMFRGLNVLVGFAESLPLAACSCDLVTAATSANWFDRPRFYDEAARVLKPSGTLLLLQNKHRYWESTLLDDFASFQECHIPGYRRGLYSDFSGGYGKADFEGELRLRPDLFAVERHRLQWCQTITANQFRGYCYSMGHIKKAINQSGATAIAKGIDALLERHQNGSGDVVVSWLTDVVLSRAKP